MLVNTTADETSLLERAVAQLNAALAPMVMVEVSGRTVPTSSGEPRLADGLIDLKTPNAFATLAVEVKSRVTPRDAETMLGGQLGQMSQLARIEFLVVAPWLSAGTREILRRRGLNYLDLTGNMFLHLEQPTIVLRTDGLQRDPNPVGKGAVRLRGPKAGRLIRLLVDVCPPYGVRALAERSGLTAGYVSRLLEALDEQALVTREKNRGPVTQTDPAGLLRKYAENYGTFTSNERFSFIAKTGAAATLAALPAVIGRVAVTGSFAASPLAPVAAPTLLTVYCTDVTSTATQLELLPSDEGANVVLLRPFDSVVWERTTERDGVSYVAPSQTVLDCLAGIGRMPAEGQALLEWMIRDESSWRWPSLDTLPRRGATST